MEARKGFIAIDGCIWRCVWDNEKGEWIKLACLGKYKTKQEAELAIKYYEEFLNEE